MMIEAATGAQPTSPLCRSRGRQYPSPLATRTLPRNRRYTRVK